MKSSPRSSTTFKAVLGGFSVARPPYMKMAKGYKEDLIFMFSTSTRKSWRRRQHGRMFSC